MEVTSETIFIISIILSLFLVSSAQSCKNYTFASKQVFTSCSELPVLQANLHWNYIPETKSVHIAYRANQTPTGWVAWAINPTGTGMVGSQAIVAFRYSNGTVAVYTTPIDSYNPLMQPGNLSFPVSNVSATYANNEMTIFAVVGPLVDGTTFNHAWQAGPVSNEILIFIQPRGRMSNQRAHCICCHRNKPVRKMFRMCPSLPPYVPNPLHSRMSSVITLIIVVSSL